MTTPRTKTAPAPEIEIPVDLFIGADVSLSVPVAGLLASKPELRESELTETKWRKELEAYLKTPIDPVAVDEAAPETE